MGEPTLICGIIGWNRRCTWVTYDNSCFVIDLIVRREQVASVHATGGSGKIKIAWGINESYDREN